MKRQQRRWNTDARYRLQTTVAAIYSAFLDRSAFSIWPQFRWSRGLAVGFVLMMLLPVGVTAVPHEGTQQRPQQLSSPIAASSNETNMTANNSSSVFSLSQGEACTVIRPLGDGTGSVERFYGYEGEPAASSLGTTDLQYSDVSQLFLYHGSRGYSLVIIHDKFLDNSPGGNANFTIVGLPATGEWVVFDDTNVSFSDDRRNRSNSTTNIHWEWEENRTDGGVYYLGETPDSFYEITISPDFNISQESIRAWGFRERGRTGLVELDMGSNVTIEPGPCIEPGTTPTPEPVPELNPREINSPEVASNRSLTVTDISVSNTTPAVGQPINVTVVVQNTGGRAVRRMITIQTAENRTVDYEIALEPREKQFIRYQKKYDEPGVYSINASNRSVTIRVKPSSTASGPGFGIGGTLVAIIAVLSVLYRSSKRSP